MPKIYMIHGFVGVGKTTFAKKLERKARAVRFSPDDWITEIYGQNPPSDKIQDYYRTIGTLIRKIARSCIAAGADAILDFGFWTRAQRDQARRVAQDVGADVLMYSLQCSEDVLRQRVARRTAEMPSGALFIDDNAIDVFKKRFEPLAPDENCVVIQTG